MSLPCSGRTTKLYRYKSFLSVTQVQLYCVCLICEILHALSFESNCNVRINWWSRVLGVVWSSELKAQRYMLSRNFLLFCHFVSCLLCLWSTCGSRNLKPRYFVSFPGSTKKILILDETKRRWNNVMYMNPPVITQCLFTYHKNPPCLERSLAH